MISVVLYIFQKKVKKDNVGEIVGDSDMSKLGDSLSTFSMFCNRVCGCELFERELRI